MKAREAHIAKSDEAIPKGEQIIGAAILNAEGQMTGSAMIVEFETQEKLEEWLENEPYVIGNVWEDIKVIPCKVGPSFAHCLKK